MPWGKVCGSEQQHLPGFVTWATSPFPTVPQCRSCNDLLVRAVPDATGQTCEVKYLGHRFWLEFAG